MTTKGGWATITISTQAGRGRTISPLELGKFALLHYQLSSSQPYHTVFWREIAVHTSLETRKCRTFKQKEKITHLPTITIPWKLCFLDSLLPTCGWAVPKCLLLARHTILGQFLSGNSFFVWFLFKGKKQGDNNTATLSALFTTRLQHQITNPLTLGFFFLCQNNKNTNTEKNNNNKQDKAFGWWWLFVVLEACMVFNDIPVCFFVVSFACRWILIQA